jgi:hypothetical protein
MRLNSAVAAWLRSPKRPRSRSSWWKAFTTRMPGIVSATTSVTRDHLRQARRNSLFMRSPCR